MRVKYFVLASSLMLSAMTFAQKDELKTLKKLMNKDVLSSDDIVKFKQNVNALSSMTGLSEEDKVYSDFYKGMVPMVEVMDVMQKNPNDQSQIFKFLTPSNINLMANSQNAVLAYEEKTKKTLYTQDIKDNIAQSKPMILQYAYGLNQASKFKESAMIFEAVYNLDKSDPHNLYNASVLSLQAKDYDNTLKYYEELKSINYTGEGINYIAVNKANGQDDTFASDDDRKKAIKIGTHEKPRDEKIPSKKGEIYKNYVSILIEKGRVDDAKKAIKEARALNPDNSDLIIAEANLYYETKDMESYKKLINEALQKRPNDADLLFNLGVVSANSGDIDNARKYYERAISVDSGYFNAYNNLGALFLIDDDKIVKEMNSLGMSAKEIKRYDELKLKRQTMFKLALPYYEKALELKPNDQGIKTMLMGVYQFLEMDAKYKALKAKN